MYDTWLERNRSPVDKRKPNIPITGSGSDHAAFVCRLGVSSVDLRFSFDPALNISSYPVYHSAYETSYYYETLVDPHYKVSTVQQYSRFNNALSQNARHMLRIGVATGKSRGHLSPHFLFWRPNGQYCWCSHFCSFLNRTF